VRHRLPSRALFGAAAVAGRPRIDALSGGADVVWLPAPAPVAVSPGVPYVLTVHDLSWVERPQDFTPYERGWHRVARLERLARHAAAVVCVSAATRDGVLGRWRLDPARVHVVHPGVEDLTERGREKAGGVDDGPGHAAAAALPSRFLLAVGALEPRKDPELLVRAFALARAHGLDADLVFAGEGRLAPRLHGDGVHLLGRVAPTGPLLQRALAVLMPSRLEGFGLPPLEAALAGTAAVVSDLPVFAETLGEAALRAPAGDADAWADAMLQLARDAPLRERLATDAAAAARRFTWERAADGLHAVLEQAAR
jgi:glycosyltransferase involved in cell wall biosynthesis